MDDLNGNVTIHLSNGDLKANSLLGNSAIHIGSGDAVVNYLRESL